jgi:hypothetical protein
MSTQTVTNSFASKLTPADLVASKPDAAFIWRQEMGRCSYDYVTQVRRWEKSEVLARMIMSTGSPTSSTVFDGESEE